VSRLDRVAADLTASGVTGPAILLVGLTPAKAAAARPLNLTGTA
jgi:hypothetical protein